VDQQQFEMMPPEQAASYLRTMRAAMKTAVSHGDLASAQAYVRSIQDLGVDPSETWGRIQRSLPSVLSLKELMAWDRNQPA
jgi:hypothetical protein